jgi:hypothetical protein
LIKDLDNFSELSQHGINTAKKVITIMAPSGATRGPSKEVNDRADAVLMGR